MKVKQGNKINKYSLEYFGLQNSSSSHIPPSAILRRDSQNRQHTSRSVFSEKNIIEKYESRPFSDLKEQCSGVNIVSEGGMFEDGVGGMRKDGVRAHSDFWRKSDLIPTFREETELPSKRSGTSELKSKSCSCVKHITDSCVRDDDALHFSVHDVLRRNELPELKEQSSGVVSPTLHPGHNKQVGGTIHINHILNRSEIANQIIHILTSFEEKCTNVNFKKGIYIYGPPGCGKTCFITEILHSLNYDIVQFDAGDVRNKALIDSLTSDNISNRNVLEMMMRRKKPIAILMKEVEALNGADRNCITQLIKLIRQKKTKKQKLENVTLNPIICLGNYYTDKKIKELMKVCNVFELKPITKQQMQSLYHLRLNGTLSEDTEMRNIGVTDTRVGSVQTTRTTLESLSSGPTNDDIIHYIQGDLRKLNFIETLLKKKPDILNSPMLLNQILHLKNYHENTKDTTQTLLENYIPIGSHSHYMNETDRTIIALLYHENIIDALYDHKSRPYISHIREQEEGNLDAVPYSNIFRKSIAPEFKEQSSVINDHSASELKQTKLSTHFFYLQLLENMCYADYIDRITFQSQIWVFNEMSSLIKTFYNNFLFHQYMGDQDPVFHSGTTYIPSHIPPMRHMSEGKEDIRFTKILTKYSTEYNNQTFIYNWCQELDMDRKDICAFFQELRLFYKTKALTQNDFIEQLIELFDETSMQKLDIKRIYRYLDKNVKPENPSDENEDE